MSTIFNKKLSLLREERSFASRTQHWLYKLAKEHLDEMLADASYIYNLPEENHHYEVLTLHKQNEVLTRCSEVTNAIFLGTFFGDGNLGELTDLFLKHQKTVVYQRVMPVIDIKIAGMLLQKAGFTNIVVDSFMIQKEYQNAIECMKDIRYLGEQNCLFGQDITPRCSLFAKILEETRSGFNITINLLKFVCIKK